MKNGSYIFIFLSVLLTACGTYKSEQQAAKLTFPELGSIIHTNEDLWYASSEQIGKPIWVEPLVIKARQLPFNKTSYTTYANYMANASKINGIPYVDTLPYKPKYLRLQLLNKIDATKQLNGQENTNVRAYIENDDAYKLVTRIDITVTDAMMPKFIEASTVHMLEDGKGGKYLVLTSKEQEVKVSLSEVQIFDYGYSSFCWGEDRYHNKQLEAILGENEKCPKGTYKKASKVKSEKSFIKI
ncbi:hypothetical protein D9V96_020365 [Zobellia laminariae]|uniref:hypothetical protein n=1 Tax=Zobellia laminariae TaxID=248906 RepID=UPI0012D91AD0|nr:hypothetical protein [Zobellia laminariae]